MTQVLSELEVEALQELKDIWREETLVLIGASALSLHVPLRWRVTYDLDVSVSVAVSEASEALSARAGWTRSTSNDYRWISPGGVKVDVLPVDFEALRSGSVDWPGEGRGMKLVGLRLAFEAAVDMEVAAGFRFPVAPMPVITVLKMAAYVDRPSERIPDLHDVAHLLHWYPDPHDELSDDRFTERTCELGLSYTEAGAFLLGADVAALVNPMEREVVERFLSKLRDADDPDLSALHLLRGAPETWQGRLDELEERVSAFELGFADAGSTRRRT